MLGATGFQRNAAIGSESHLGSRESLIAQRPLRRRTRHARTIEARGGGGGKIVFVESSLLFKHVCMPGHPH